MSSHSKTLSWFWANQSLFLFLNDACLAEKHEIKIRNITYVVYKTIVLYVQIGEALKHDLELMVTYVRRIWRYRSGNQNPYIEKKQTTQWPNEKAQKDKQRSTNHIHKTKDRVTRTPQKPGVNSSTPEGWAVPVPLVTPIVLISYNSSIDNKHVLKAIELSRNGSTVLTFTDASAKDEDRFEEVIMAAQERNITVTSILTGSCSRRKRRSISRMFRLFLCFIDYCIMLID